MMLVEEWMLLLVVKDISSDGPSAGGPVQQYPTSTVMKPTTSQPSLKVVLTEQGFTPEVLILLALHSATNRRVAGHCSEAG